MLNLDNFASEYGKLHASYEKQAYLTFKRALDKQHQAVIEYAEKNGAALTGAVLSVLIDSKLTEAAYIDVYTSIGVRHARNYSRLLDKMLQPKKHSFIPMEQKAIGFSSVYWRTIMAQLFQTEAAGKVTEVDETTKKRIRDILAESQAQGLSVLDQAKYLRQKLNDSRFNQTRAMLIARTESTATANSVAARVGQEADFMLLKKWISALDSRTRNSHRIVGIKEPIPINQLFEVPSPSGAGIEYAQHPGDRSLSVGNVANCRCILAHVPVLDSEGMPIPKK